MNCPECGAEIHEAGACQALFESFLVKDYTDPGYGAVHALTVSCFMIQHNRYSDEAMVWMRDKLSRYLEEDLTGEQFRQIARQDTSSTDRKWKVTRRPSEKPLPEVSWRVTIADVAAQAIDAESYRRSVKEWARSTLEQMILPG